MKVSTVNTKSTMDQYCQQSIHNGSQLIIIMLHNPQQKSADHHNGSVLLALNPQWKSDDHHNDSVVATLNPQ